MGVGGIERNRWLTVDAIVTASGLLETGSSALWNHATSRIEALAAAVMGIEYFTFIR